MISNIIYLDAVHTKILDNNIRKSLLNAQVLNSSSIYRIQSY